MSRRPSGRHGDPKVAATNPLPPVVVVGLEGVLHELADEVRAIAPDAHHVETNVALVQASNLAINFRSIEAQLAQEKAQAQPRRIAGLEE